MTPTSEQDGGRLTDPALRLQPGQERLTPEQGAEAERFARAYIEAQLSTEPVDEPEAEALLRQAYGVAGLAPPQRIQWVDGPLQLVAVLAPPSVWDRVWESVYVSVRESVRDRVWESVRDRVWSSFRDRVEARFYVSVRYSVEDSVMRSVEASVWEGVRDSVRYSVSAYGEASWLAIYHFFAVYLASNALYALAASTNWSPAIGWAKTRP